MILSLFWPRPKADPAVFEREALPHLDSLYRTACRLCGNQRDAEDLVQETCMRAWKYFHQFEPGTNCRAWLMRILHNVHLSSWQRRSRAPVSVSLEASEDFFLYSHLRDDDRSVPTPEEEVMAGIVDSQIVEALDGLPEEYRVAVVLCDVEELTYKEIAGILDVPIGTVRSRLARGRRLLQKRLLEDRAQLESPALRRGRTDES